MNLQKRLEYIQSLKSSFEGEWIAKKSRLPFLGYRKAPAFFCEQVRFESNWIDFGSGVRFKYAANAPKPQIFIEAIPADYAEYLNQTFKAALKAPIVDVEAVTVDGCHIRKDNGAVKVAYSDTNYHDALYRLMVLYPDHDCKAYRCPVCNHIHIGKQPKVELPTKKDFNDTPLAIGDTIAYIMKKNVSARSSTSFLRKGTIIAFTEKMVTIKSGDETLRRLPEHTALIDAYTK